MLAIAVARYLAAEIDFLVYDEDGTDGNLFVAWMPSTPDIAVALMPQPGTPQLSKLPTDTPGLQALIRGEAQDPRPSYEMARTIYDALTCLDLVTLDEGGDDETRVIGCTALQSDPVGIGQDSNQRHEWSLNFSFRTHAPTTHRSAA